MSTEKPEEFYRKLKIQLEDTSTWPSIYLYKFIVPTSEDKINKIQNIFDNTGAVIESKQSKKGTYTSISITVNLANAEAVIEKYKEVGKVEGVISL
jgi:putative lipoic acid-binding regulatory protein